MNDIWVLVRTIDEYDEDLFIGSWNKNPTIEQVNEKIPSEAEKWCEYLVMAGDNQGENGETYEIFMEEN